MNAFLLALVVCVALSACGAGPPGNSNDNAADMKPALAEITEQADREDLF